MIRNYFKKMYSEGAEGGAGQETQTQETPKPAETKTETKTYFQGFTPEMVEKLEKAKEAEFEKILEQKKQEWQTEFEENVKKRQEEEQRNGLIKNVEEDESLKKKFVLYGWDYKTMQSENLNKFINMWKSEKENKTPIPEGGKTETENKEITVESLTNAFRKIRGGK